MDDARLGRYDTEVPKRPLPPLQELIALAIALVLQDAVQREGFRERVVVDLHGMVDDEIRRLQGVDVRRIASHGNHRLAHRGKIDHRRNPREVLHQDPGWPVRDFSGRNGRGIPVQDRLYVPCRNAAPILVSQEVFQQDLDRVRQPRDDRPGQGGQAVIVVPPLVEFQCGLGFERIHDSPGRSFRRRVPILAVQGCLYLPTVDRLPAAHPPRVGRIATAGANRSTAEDAFQVILQATRTEMRRANRSDRFALPAVGMLHLLVARTRGKARRVGSAYARTIQSRRRPPGTEAEARRSSEAGTAQARHGDAGGAVDRFAA